MLAITGVTFGTLIDRFKGWSYLIDNSPDIVIARCTATLGFTPPDVAPKMQLYPQADIEVISILKGATKPGLSRLSSFYSPYQGELFVIFGSYMTSGTNSWYNANEEYKIVPLNRHFRLSDLNGKTLDEQIQIILASRINDLKNEIAQDNEEKERLKQGLKNKVSTNAPAINKH